MAEKIAELVTRNQDSKWKYLGDAKGGFVSLPSVWNEVLIECINTTTFVAVGTAIITWDMAPTNDNYYVRVANSAQNGNVAFSRERISENYLEFHQIKVYVR